MVWNRHVSNLVREIGYDIAAGTMAVVFSDKTLRYHAPVSYSLYAAFAHASSPGRYYKQVVEGKIPQVDGPALKRS